MSWSGGEERDRDAQEERRGEERKAGRGWVGKSKAARSPLPHSYIIKTDGSFVMPRH